MLTYFEMEPGTSFLPHSHEAEQITMVLEGEMLFAYEINLEIVDSLLTARALLGAPRWRAQKYP
ncbi:MAG: cupin domain-containing protein [Nitrospiraceae bacterium]|nr:cupin domain-containing protein [Nitrospiraceae bacterium]